MRLNRSRRRVGDVRVVDGPWEPERKKRFERLRQMAREGERELFNVDDDEPADEGARGDV